MSNQAKYGENLSFFTEKSKPDAKNTAKKEEKPKAKATQTANDAPKKTQGDGTGNYGVGNLSKGALDILSKVFGGSGKIDATPKSSKYGANIKNTQGGKNNG